jgi:hypothetical protein
MDRWAWRQLEPWLHTRSQLPIGALLCVIHGPTAGRHWEPSAARKQLRHDAVSAGVRRRFAPHQLRHAHAVQMAHEGVPLVVIQRQLGHYAGDRVKGRRLRTGRRRVGCGRRGGVGVVNDHENSPVPIVGIPHPLGDRPASESGGLGLGAGATRFGFRRCCGHRSRACMTRNF